jgi:hypothetical protein
LIEADRITQKVCVTATPLQVKALDPPAQKKKKKVVTVLDFSSLSNI